MTPPLPESNALRTAKHRLAELLGRAGILKPLAVHLAPERHPAAKSFGEPFDAHQVQLAMDRVDAGPHQVAENVEDVAVRMEEHELVLGVQNLAVFAIEGAEISRHISGATSNPSAVPQSSRKTTPSTSVSAQSSSSLQAKSWSMASRPRIFLCAPGKIHQRRLAAAQKPQAVERPDFRPSPARTAWSPGNSCSPWQTANDPSNSAGGW